MVGSDEERAAWRRIRREERGISSPDENRALDWLATRLQRQDNTTTGKISDWHVASTWESHHGPKLKMSLQNIDPRDHAAIDRAFEQYQLKNGLLIETAPEPNGRDGMTPRKFQGLFPVSRL